MQGKPFLGKNSETEAEYIFGARDRIDERHDMVRSVRDKRYRYCIPGAVNQTRKHVSAYMVGSKIIVAARRKPNIANKICFPIRGDNRSKYGCKDINQYHCKADASG